MQSKAEILDLANRQDFLTLLSNNGSKNFDLKWNNESITDNKIDEELLKEILLKYMVNIFSEADALKGTVKNVDSLIANSIFFKNQPEVTDEQKIEHFYTKLQEYNPQANKTELAKSYNKIKELIESKKNGVNQVQWKNFIGGLRKENDNLLTKLQASKFVDSFIANFQSKCPQNFAKSNSTTLSIDLLTEIMTGAKKIDGLSSETQNTLSIKQQNYREGIKDRQDKAYLELATLILNKPKEFKIDKIDEEVYKLMVTLMAIEKYNEVSGKSSTPEQKKEKFIAALNVSLEDKSHNNRVTLGDLYNTIKAFKDEPVATMNGLTEKLESSTYYSATLPNLKNLFNICLLSHLDDQVSNIMNQLQSTLKPVEYNKAIEQSKIINTTKNGERSIQQ